MLWWCSLRFPQQQKSMFGSSLPPVASLRYMCLFAHSGVHHMILCCVICFFVSSSCVLSAQCCQCLWIFDSWLPLWFLYLERMWMQINSIAHRHKLKQRNSTCIAGWSGVIICAYNKLFAVVGRGMGCAIDSIWTHWLKTFRVSIFCAFQLSVK